MAYVSLYRKWRPQSFADVAGQDNIVKTLKNSLKSGRLTHAYLFCGPRGTGKTTIARLLARGLNCQEGPTSEPCGICDECIGITEGTSLNVIEIDGASNRGIDDIRELRGQVQYTPINAKYKVYIIDEVHMLTTEAFNALLKTLEEPPAHVVFIFATTDPHRLPPTILSRVQRYDFQKLSQESMVTRLETVLQGETITFEKEALLLISRHAEGGMRDALSILEKCVAYTQEVTTSAVEEVLGIAPLERVESFVAHLLAGEKVEAFEVIDQLYGSGRDLTQFIHGVLEQLRLELLEKKQIDEELILKAVEILSETVREMRFAVDPRIPLEIATLKITTTPKQIVAVTDELEAKIRALEQEVRTLKAQIASGKIKSEGEEKCFATTTRPTLSSDDKKRTQELIAMWPEYLLGLRREKLMQCEAFLKEGTPVGASGNTLTVAFPRDRGFHKASIEQDNHREPAERVLAKLVGFTLQLKCVFQDEVDHLVKGEEPVKTIPKKEPAKPKGKKEIAGDASGESPDAQKFIEVSLETFGGKIFTKPTEK